MIVNRTKIRVRYSDTDQMGVVYYSRYFEYFEVGRTELLRQLGIPYSKMEKLGVKLPVAETKCLYKTPVSYDDEIIVETRLEKFPRASIRIDYKIFKAGDNSMVAEGYTIHPFINDKNKTVRIPGFFKDILLQFWGH